MRNNSVAKTKALQAEVLVKKTQNNSKLQIHTDK